MLSSLLVFSLLSGCVPGSPSESQNSTKKVTSESESSSVTTTSAEKPPEGVESFIPIGKKVKIWYLQHINNNDYQVGLRTSDKLLVWQSIQPVNVFLEENIEMSYIERIADWKDGFGEKHPQFNLHLKVDAPSNGGTVQKGKGSSIETDMIIGGGSW